MPTMPGGGLMGTLCGMLRTPDTRRTGQRNVAPIHRKGHETDNNRYTSDLPTHRNTSRKPSTDIIQICPITKSDGKRNTGKVTGKSKQSGMEGKQEKIRPQWKRETIKSGTKEVKEWERQDQERRRYGR